MWDAWQTLGASPRNEVVHQVVNQYNNNMVKPPVARAEPFGPCIRVGRFKLIGGKPGDNRIVRWPAPESSPVPFGLTGGTQESGTDHFRAGGIGKPSKSPKCDPWCLYDLESDPSESHDLASDPSHANTVSRLAA